MRLTLTQWHELKPGAYVQYIGPAELLFYNGSIYRVIPSDKKDQEQVENRKALAITMRDYGYSASRVLTLQNIINQSITYAYTYNYYQLVGNPYSRFNLIND